LKGVDYESRPVDLREGEQRSSGFLAVNPQGLVPMLEIDGHRLTQSLAIIAYLDLRFPNQPLIPASAADRAHVTAMAMTIACDIHPLNNLRILQYLKNELGHSQDEVDAWYRHWISEGLPALEAMARPTAGKFLFGDAPTGADVCLVPQLYNARRFNVPLDDYPTLLRAEENANKLDGFAAAAPERQEVPA
jgi:maleylacetoacetate isomerase